jgi:very-short-patch-repair endonuclease
VDDSLADYESILDVCCTLGMPRRRLHWHYRSRREPLIAFSNRHFYDNELVTFPSVLDTGLTPAVRFEYLPHGRWKAGSSGGFNPIEALSTAELVMDHFQKNPALSLGVIAFSQRQQMAILDELERLRRADSSFEEFFSEDSEEPFFVKNLENVQGDERDVIFLSIGYARTEDKAVPSMNFGPLNRQGGQRRLNVAVTRARSAMTVISSMRSHDIDLSRTNAIGAKLLRSYLDFAERGVSALGSEISEVDQEDYDSPFEHEVRDALVKRGMEVKKQVGCSGYKIDLALVDPRLPGRFILGIECDGATYHSSATARDRDRLRQEVLESLGWQIVRIWSTDWMRDPEGQIRRVVDVYERRVNAPSDADAPVMRRDSDECPVDEQPVATSQNGPRLLSMTTATYQRIVDVPTSVIKDLVLSLLESYGVTDQTQLTVSVARQLGFQRTGAKIRERIERCVVSLLSEKKILRTEDGALKLNSNNGLRLA